MTDSPPDDARLRSAEAHMRRVLGLRGDTQRHVATDYPATSTNGSHPQRRRFVRDGEVPVTVIHREPHPDGEPGSNHLQAARQALRSEAAAKERAERMLADAQAAVRVLQTKLAHERLAKDEALQRTEAESQASEQALQSVRTELLAERAVRVSAEQAARDAQAATRDLEGRLDGVRAELATERRARRNAEDALRDARYATAPAPADEAAIPPVRRPVGRPRKATAEPQPAAKPRGAKVARKPARAARQPSGKPIKWWLPSQ
jgi:hypothetical protein